MKIDNTVKFIFTSSLLLKRWHHYSCAHLWVMSSLMFGPRMWRNIVGSVEIMVLACDRYDRLRVIISQVQEHSCTFQSDAQQILVTPVYIDTTQYTACHACPWLVAGMWWAVRMLSTPLGNASSLTSPSCHLYVRRCVVLKALFTMHMKDVLSSAMQIVNEQWQIATK